MKKTCAFCGWIGHAPICPECKDYKGLNTDEDIRQFNKRQQAVIEKLKAETPDEKGTP